MTSSNTIFGLVLTGGQSKRMNQDKALLVYNGTPQVRRAVDLLAEFCAQTWISTTLDRASLPGYKEFSQIHDAPAWEGAGPLSGILTAMNTRPEAAWLILACDLPLIDEAAIRTLLDHRDQAKLATAYISTRDRLPEPLCAVYEPRYRARLEEFFQKGIPCPRKIMIQSDVNLIEQKDPRWLDNVNTPEEYRQILRELEE